ncbi:hypothetical protein [Algoriphagus sp.]|uniref:hypothetical protein n=1 Tax=Algoriphagus sp. TaxID=1872435 RepID=UPI003279AEDF
MSSIFKFKWIQTTFGILTVYLGMMILAACMSETELDPFGECEGTVKANAKDVSFFYEPYKNNQYVTKADTVKFSEFTIYMRIEAEVMAEASSPSNSFGAAYALSCAAIFDFQNIKSITMELLEPYGNKPAGTDISNLVTTHDGVKLSDLKNFSNSIGQYRLSIDILPAHQSQLKTKTILKLKNGSDKIVESTSPVLLTN